MITELGYELKRLATVVEENRARVRAAFAEEGVTVVVTDDSALGILCAIFSRPTAELHELGQAVYASQYPGTAVGAGLDNVLALANIRRKAAGPSLVWQVLTGDLNTLIPEDSLVQHDTTAKRLRVQEDVTLDEDVVVACDITVSSAATNGLTFTIMVDGNVYTVTSSSHTNTTMAAALAALVDPTTLAVSAVSQADKTFTTTGDKRKYFAVGKRMRVQGSTGNDAVYTVADLSYNGVSTTITVLEDIGNSTADGYVRGYVSATSASAVITLSSIDDAYGNKLPESASDLEDFAFQYETSGTPGVLTTTSISVPTQVASIENDAIEAEAETVTVIATPVSGWVSTSNPIAADVGNLRESDVDARTRRTASLQATALQTVLGNLVGVDEVKVYENEDSEEDADGRPAHAVECVVTGGNDDEIAETIRKYKAAGTPTYGNTFKTTTDVTGRQHLIYFSRPTTVRVYVAVTVVTMDEEQDLPDNVTAAIQEAVEVYGGTLKAGTDVYAKRIAGYVVLTVPRIADVTVYIGTSPSPAATTPITVTADQRATIDRDDVTVSGV